MNSSLDTLWVVEPSKDKFWVVIHELQTSWTLPDLKRAQHRGYDDQTQNFTTKQKKIQQNPGSEKKDVIPIHFFGLIESIHPILQNIPKPPGLMFRQENELIVGKLKTLKLEAELQHEKWIYSTDPPRAWSQTWSQKVCWAVCWDLFEVFKSCSSGRCRYINCQCDILFDMIYHIIAHNDVTWFDFILIW